MSMLIVYGLLFSCSFIRGKHIKTAFLAMKANIKLNALGVFSICKFIKRG